MTKKAFFIVSLLFFLSLASAVYGLECGDTIYESITLTEDILNCAGECEQKSCWDFDSLEECGGASGCSWNSTMDFCVGNYNVSVECSIHDSNTCNEQSDCEWEFDDGWGLFINDSNDIILDCDGYSVEGDEAIGVYDSENITVKNCNISNARTAVEVEYSQDVQLLNNNFQYMDENILEIAFSNNIIISGNNLNYADEMAIEFSNVTYSEISYNTINGNGDNGINIEQGSDYNNIYDNTVSYNEEDGIKLENSYNNTIWNNNFSNNGENNAYEENSYDNWNLSDIGNYWNLSDIGNYWSDFENNSEFPDNYTIPGSGGVDYYPLNEVYPYCGATITENTTLTEDLLGCTGNGLLIGADNITLDCDGHLIDFNYSYRNHNSIRTGIYLNQVNGITIKNCEVSGFYNGTGLHYSSNNIFTNNIFTNNYVGISLSYSNYNNMYDNTMSYNTHTGIYVGNSNDNNISGNTVSNNNEHGIGLYFSNDNNIYDNIVNDNNTYGIFLYRSDDNSISGNTVSNNNEHGIYLGGNSKDNNISGNTASYNEDDGIRLETSNNNTIWNNNFSNNGENNAYEYSSWGNDWNLSNVGNYWSDFEDNPGFPMNYTIPGDGDGVDYHPLNEVPDVYCGAIITENTTLTEDLLDCSNNGLLIGASNITLDCDGYSVEGDGSGNYDIGIYLYQVNGITVKNCNVSGFVGGINISYGDYNTISGNTVSNNNNNGIGLDYSNDNSIYDNTVSNNNNGIYLHYYNENNNISGNTVSYNNNNGIRLDSSHNNNMYDNIVNDNNNKGIYLYRSDDNIISGNTVSNNNNGIYLHYYSENNNISGNTVSYNNNNGIYLYYWNGKNSIYDNTVSYNNNTGIYLYQNDNNSIWNNQFIDNNNLSAYQDSNSNNNNWNLSEVGNYWSDFEDNPGFPMNYIIPGWSGGVDYYPLNEKMPDLTVINISSFLSDAGDETIVEVTFKNIGSESSDYSYAYNFDYEGRDLIRDSFSGRGLEPGAEATISVSYVYDFAGDYTFYFELDPNNLIDEFDESNNIGLESYFINGTPDLTSVLLSFEQSFENPNLVTFNIEVSALGGTIWVDDFTYNIDYGDGVGEGGLISETIMPWESYNFSLTHDYSTFGDYNVFFEVDPENLIFEFDEDNNFFETTITLEDLFEDCIKGDVNLDEEIDVLDIVLLVSHIIEGEELNELQLCAADYNSDDEINVLDITDLVNEILDPERGITKSFLLKKIQPILSKDTKLETELKKGVLKKVKKSKMKSKNVRRIEPIKLEEVELILPNLKENARGK